MSKRLRKVFKKRLPKKIQKTQKIQKIKKIKNKIKKEKRLNLHFSRKKKTLQKILILQKIY